MLKKTLQTLSQWQKGAHWAVLNTSNPITCVLKTTQAEVKRTENWEKLSRGSLEANLESLHNFW